MAKLLSRMTEELQAASTEGWDLDSSRDSRRGGEEKRTVNMLVKDLNMALQDLSEKDAGDVKIFLGACLQHGSSKVIDELALPVLQSRNNINWKDHCDIISYVLDSMSTEGLYRRSYGCSYSSAFTEVFLQVIKRNALMPKFKGKILLLIDLALQHAETLDKKEPLPIHGCYRTLLDGFPWKESSKEATNVLKILRQVTQKSPRMLENDVCSRLVTTLCRVHSVPFLTDINQAVVELFDECVKNPLVIDKKRTNCYQLLTDIMEDYIERQSSTPQLAAPLMAGVKRLWRCGDPELEKAAGKVIFKYAGNYELIHDIVDVLLDLILSGENSDILSNICGLYPQCPEVFHARFDKFVYALRSAGRYEQCTFLQLFWSMARLHPEVFSPQSVTVVAECLRDDRASDMAFEVLNSVADKQPEQVYCHVEALKDWVKRKGQKGIGDTLVFVALSRGDQERAIDCLQFLDSLLHNMPTVFPRPVLVNVINAYEATVLYNMKKVGLECPEALAEYRAVFEARKNDDALQDICWAILDVIDGRSLKEVDNAVSEQQQKILHTWFAERGDNLESMAKEMDAKPGPSAQAQTSAATSGTDHDIL